MNNQLPVEHTKEETPFMLKYWCGAGLRPSGVRISKWNGREDRQRKTVSVGEGMDYTERNCRCVGGRRLAEGNS